MLEKLSSKYGEWASLEIETDGSGNIIISDENRPYPIFFIDLDHLMELLNS